MADPSPGRKIKVDPPSDIYTVWVIIATLFVLFGTAFLGYRSYELFGTWLPIGP